MNAQRRQETDRAEADEDRARKRANRALWTGWQVAHACREMEEYLWSVGVPCGEEEEEGAEGGGGGEGGGGDGGGEERESEGEDGEDNAVEMTS